MGTCGLASSSAVPHRIYKDVIHRSALFTKGALVRFTAGSDRGLPLRGCKRAAERRRSSSGRCSRAAARVAGRTFWAQAAELPPESAIGALISYTCTH